MAKHYTMKVPKNQIWSCSDMLRYDDAYQAREDGENYQVETLRFTPDRWASFGYIPDATEMTIPLKEWGRLIEQAQGFTSGIRFAQQYLSGPYNRYQTTMLVQS